jgi:hypothetical protein
MNVMKMLETYDLRHEAAGSVRFFSFDKNGRIVKMVRLKNLILYNGADILAKLISGASGYHISTMYMEFVNLAAPGDPVVIPTFDRSGGTDYYDSLSASADADFLRVPLQIAATLSSSDEDVYAHNKVTLMGVSEGTQGFHGKTFGSSANSVVRGAALVAAPDQTDQSRDLVFSRVYAGGVSGWAEAIEKEAGTQIAVTWTIRFN